MIAKRIYNTIFFSKYYSYKNYTILCPNTWHRFKKEAEERRIAEEKEAEERRIAEEKEAEEREAEEIQRLKEKYPLTYKEIIESKNNNHSIKRKDIDKREKKARRKLTLEKIKNAIRFHNVDRGEK